MIKKFPKGFLWGAATSAHQVEGGCLNNWTEWEKKNALRLAKEAEEKWQKWQKEKFSEMFNPANYISGRACDHYHRFAEDFDLAKTGGHNAHRFSIEWSRIEPEEGKFNEKEVEHYRQVVLALRQRKIEPFVTLWHWTHPIWLEKIGGIKNQKFIFYFSRYTRFLVERLGAKINFWITLNEPNVVAAQSFLRGVWPPQKKNLRDYFLAINHLLTAHQKTFLIIKNLFPRAQVGIAKHQISFQVLQSTMINKLAKKLGDYFWNKRFLKKINYQQDFIGLNHYRRRIVEKGLYRKTEERLTDLGWEFYPESLFQALVELKAYEKPIYVTENGLADADDFQRKEFLFRALSALYSAKKIGVDVRGYFHWSLLDNFEWDKGFWPRFGLIKVDFKTLKRTPRSSFYFYRDIIKRNAL